MKIIFKFKYYNKLLLNYIKNNLIYIFFIILLYLFNFLIFKNIVYNKHFINDFLYIIFNIIIVEFNKNSIKKILILNFFFEIIKLKIFFFKSLINLINIQYSKIILDLKTSFEIIFEVEIFLIKHGLWLGISVLL